MIIFQLFFWRCMKLRMSKNEMSIFGANCVQIRWGVIYKWWTSFVRGFESIWYLKLFDLGSKWSKNLNFWWTSFKNECLKNHAQDWMRISFGQSMRIKSSTMNMNLSLHPQPKHSINNDNNLNIENFVHLGCIFLDLNVWLQIRSRRWVRILYNLRFTYILTWLAVQINCDPWPPLDFAWNWLYRWLLSANCQYLVLYCP